MVTNDTTLNGKPPYFTKFIVKKTIRITTQIHGNGWSWGTGSDEEELHEGDEFTVSTLRRSWSQDRDKYLFVHLPSGKEADLKFAALGVFIACGAIEQVTDPFNELNPDYGSNIFDPEGS